MKTLFRRHAPTFYQFGKFGVIGALGFVMDYLLFHLALDQFGFNHYASALFSFPFTVCFTWLGNRLFTFRGEHTGSMQAQLLRFLLVCSIGLVLNRGTFSLLTATVPLVYSYPILGLMAGTGVGMFFNFFFTRRLVFR